MDPFTHTFLGAALADSGVGQRLLALRLGKETAAPAKRAAGAAAPSHGGVVVATLIVGANLPDVDFVTYFLDGDLSLYLRRGWTHGILAMVVLPWLLALGVRGWCLLRQRRVGAGGVTAGPPALARLLALACLGVWSHPALDWLNTYGVRLLMPFDGRWFYGDVLFIIEPWLWLLLGGSVFLCHSTGLRARLAWGSLAVLMSVVVLQGAPGSLARGGWLAGLAALAVLRWWRPVSAAPPSPLPARLALLASALYVTLLMVGDAYVEGQVRAAWERGEHGMIEEMMVGPLPANPLHRDVLVATAEHYYFFTWDWRRRPPLQPAEPATLRRLEHTPEVEAALVAPCLRGMANWLRFPFAEVEVGPEGVTVHLLDARYTRRSTSSFGGARVRLDGDLRPRCDPR